MESWRTEMLGDDAPKVQTCTRPFPHICKVNGPCNGWPRGVPEDTQLDEPWHETQERLTDRK